jgi:hypothetical protein
VPRIDGRDWCPDGDFTDGFHLLPLAAARFSERPGQEALPRLLRGGP